MIRSLCPDYCPPPIYNCTPPFPPQNNLLDRPILTDEVTKVIRDLNIKSSPGLDSISYNMLSHSPVFIHKLLGHIYNEILFSGFFPLQWKKSLVFLIPKATPDKLRPISLTSTLLKILEKILATRLQWFCEEKKLFLKTQFGFRKGNATIIWHYSPRPLIQDSL